MRIIVNLFVAYLWLFGSSDRASFFSFFAIISLSKLQYTLALMVMKIIKREISLPHCYKSKHPKQLAKAADNIVAAEMWLHNYQ